MKPFHLVVLSVLFPVVALAQQPRAPFTPYNKTYFDLKGSVKSVLIQEKSVEYNSEFSKRINFDNTGRVASMDFINGQKTITRTFTYDESGRLVKVAGDCVKYIPEYNKNGDLIKETYITEISNGVKYGFFQEYSYDVSGLVLSNRICYMESECSTTEYLYKDGKLVQQTEYGLGENYQSDCDATGRFVSMKVINSENNKVLSQSKYTYQIDEQNNWIKKDLFKDNHLQSTTTREITYY